MANNNPHRNKSNIKRPRAHEPEFPVLPTTQSFSDNYFGNRFFVLHSATEKPLAKMDPFFIEKSIKGLVGTVNKVSNMRSGDLLVEVPNAIIANSLMRVSAFGDIPISVTPHRSLNSSKGVVISRDLLHVTEESLKENLLEEGVVDVKRIMLRKDGVQTPSRVLILTYNRTNLPETVKVGYLRCQVRPYIPNPLRCFLCQRYGHSKNVCRGSPICARCAISDKDHDSETCVLDPVCANCKGAHPAYSRSCPRWQQEKAVQSYRVRNKVSYPEARRAVMPFTTNPDRPLYSTAVKNQTVPIVSPTVATSASSQPVTSPCLQCLQRHKPRAPLWDGKTLPKSPPRIFKNTYKSAEFMKQTAGPDTAGFAKPAQTSGSVQAPKPVRASGSGQASKPAKTSGSSQASKPAKTSGSSQASKPAKTSGSSQASKPAKVSGSSQALKPAKPSETGQAPPTAQASKPEQTKKPAKTSASGQDTPITTAADSDQQYSTSEAHPSASAMKEFKLHLNSFSGPSRVPSAGTMDVDPTDDDMDVDRRGNSPRNKGLKAKNRVLPPSP